MEKEHTWIKIRAQLPCLAALRSGQTPPNSTTFRCHWRLWSQIGSDQQRTVVACTAVRFTTALAALRREQRRVVDGEAATLSIRTIEGMFASTPTPPHHRR